jgi:hypothetical protein
MPVAVVHVVHVVPVLDGLMPAVCAMLVFRDRMLGVDLCLRHLASLPDQASPLSNKAEFRPSRIWAINRREPDNEDAE